ncbi:MAG: response regulator [Candidatus Rokubacteria bacterium]|nr:response regulator [Candidatus Rokubacteria bacterium]
MDPIRVLYVEDDPDDRELTRRHLERHAPHLKLAVAETVQEALDRLTVGDVDLVLSDYRLPDGTGLDLLETIKAREFEVPVVLVTGSGDAEAAVRLLKAGAADYVVKRPGYPETLPPIVEGAFRWFQSASEVRRTPIRVLYAEHDPADVELTRRAFREHGRHLHLDIAPRGHDVLQRLRTAPYDLLLLDYRLPDLNGIEVLQELRGERIRVPVVMVTGQGEEETAVEAFKLGAADYIIKEGSYLAKLPSTLENVLAQCRLADEKDALLVLNGLARSITTLRDLGELVQLVARAAADLLKAEIGILWLADGMELRPVSVTGMAEVATETLRLPLPEPTRERAAAQRRVDIPALLPAGAPAPGHGLEGVRGSLGISLVTGARLVGVLAVAHRQPREFGGMDERLLTILADHAAIAIENARLYQQLKDRLDELQHTQARLLQTEKVAAMGELLAGVAHELNNPLSIMIGRTALLQQALTAGPLAGGAQKIAQAAERCARIVKNFLALARQRPPERRSVDINQLVSEAVELVVYSLRVDNVEVAFDLADGLPVVWADPHQLHQVLVNFVTNAHHAMREVAPPRRLTLATRFDATRGRVYLEVADTGPGIPREIQARIFEPFFTTKPPGQGTGLGLSLCRGIVEGHGGTLDVESEPGRGALFRVELPVTPARVTGGEAPAPEAPAPVPGKLILVVDDEPEVASVLADLLSAEGHQVETADNGVIALEKLSARTYDLVVSDVRMPGLDGPALYRELERRRPEVCRRFVFVTGDDLSSATREFLEATRARRLNKPFDLDEIRRVVQGRLEPQ